MPAQVQYARNGEVAIAYEAFGDLTTGEPLLLIMGLDFQMVWWPDGFVDRLVEQGFAVVRFDNRDTGLSTKFGSAPQTPLRALLGRGRPAYTGHDMLADALAVMDAVGWASAHVMGDSLGAGLAQALAALHPARVRSLISLQSFPVDAGPLRILGYLKYRVPLRLSRLKPAATREGEIDTLVAIARTVASPTYPFAAEWARAAATTSHDRSPRDPRSAQRQLAAARAQKPPSLSAVTAPTLVISGGADPIMREKGGRDTARRITGATFVSYPQMGHNLPEELWPDLVAQISAIARISAVASAAPRRAATPPAPASGNRPARTTR